MTKHNIHITDHRINHCECACHYFPTMIIHNNKPCCNADKLFEKKITINTERKVQMES